MLDSFISFMPMGEKYTSLNEVFEKSLGTTKDLR